MIDRRYKTLAVLAKNLSYTQTAHQLYITQPAVSQQISSLEHELNIQLVSKKGPHVSLTSAGEKLVQYINKINIESTQLLTLLKDNTQTQTIAVGSTLSLSIFLLPHLLSNLLTENIKIKTTIANTNQILAAIRSGKVDFGLVEGNFDKTELDAITIRNEAYVCVTYPTNLLIAQKKITIADLLEQTLLIREKGSGTRDILANWLAVQNYNISDFRHQIEISNPMTVIELLKQKIGVSFMYQSLITDALANNQLVRLPLEGFAINHPINLIYLKDSYFAQTYLTIAQKLPK